MTFWTAKNIATQKPFNFYLKISSLNNTHLLWEARSVKLPSYGKEIISDQYGREIRKTESTNEWSSFTIDIYDLAGISYSSPNHDLPLSKTNRNTWAYELGENSTSYSVIQWIANQEGFEDILGASPDYRNRWNIKMEPLKISIIKLYTNQATKIDSEGDPLQQPYANVWTITKPILESVEFGTLDYTSSDPVMVSITFKPESPGSVVVSNTLII